MRAPAVLRGRGRDRRRRGRAGRRRRCRACCRGVVVVLRTRRRGRGRVGRGCSSSPVAPVPAAGDEGGGEELEAVPLGVRPGVALHVAGVLRRADDEADPSSHGARWAWYVFIGDHRRVASTRPPLDVVHGPQGSRATSMRQLLAPVAVDLRRRDPLPGEVPRLHRVLGVVTVEERPAPRRDRRLQPSSVRYSGAASRRPAGRGPATSRWPSAGRRRTRPRRARFWSNVLPNR